MVANIYLFWEQTGGVLTAGLAAVLLIYISALIHVLLSADLPKQEAK